MIEETNLTATSNSKTMESWVTEKLLVQLYETNAKENCITLGVALFPGYLLNNRKERAW